MEKNMMVAATPNAEIRGMVQHVIDAVKSPVEWLRAYYSSICGKPLTMSQTALLLNAQAAFIASALPADMPIAARIVSCVWLVASLWQCRRKI